MYDKLILYLFISFKWEVCFKLPFLKKFKSIKDQQRFKIQMLFKSYTTNVFIRFDLGVREVFHIIFQ